MSSQADGSIARTEFHPNPFYITVIYLFAKTTGTTNDPRSNDDKTRQTLAQTRLHEKKNRQIKLGEVGRKRTSCTLGTNPLTCSSATGDIYDVLQEKTHGWKSQRPCEGASICSTCRRGRGHRGHTDPPETPPRAHTHTPCPLPSALNLHGGYLHRSSPVSSANMF